MTVQCFGFTIFDKLKGQNWLLPLQISTNKSTHFFPLAPKCTTQRLKSYFETLNFRPWQHKHSQDNIDMTILTVQTIFRLKYITLFEALLPSPHGMCYILTSLISRTNYLESLTLKIIGNDKGVFFHLHPNLSSYIYSRHAATFRCKQKRRIGRSNWFFSCLASKMIDVRN
mgnify:CR=1 FL=1